MKDVSGQDLQIGDKVAFCLGGKGTQMRIGLIDRMTEKSVIMKVKEAQWRYNSFTRRYDIIEMVDAQVVRAFDAVSKIINQKGEEA